MRHLLSLLLFLAPVLLTSQNSVIDITIGNAIFRGILKPGVSKNPDDYIHKIKVTTSDDGIISSINLLSNPDLVNPIVTDVVRSGSEITIKSSYASQVRENFVKWSDARVQIFGARLTRKNPGYVDVLISPRPDVIYESPEIILTLKKGQLVESFKKNPSDYSALQYNNNVLVTKYKVDSYIDYKYVFRFSSNSTSIDYFSQENDVYDKYSPPIEIRGPRLYSTDMRINVINYFILKASPLSMLQEILFPSIFLDK